MSQQQGPWSAPPSKPPASASSGGLARLAIWAAIIALGGCVFWFRNQTGPGRLGGGADRARVFLNLGMLALMAAGVTRLRGLKIGTVARNAGVWAGIVGVAAVGYAYRNELAHVGARVVGQLSPADAVATGPREVTITAGESGHFEVWGLVNGGRVRFLVDTGATDIVLSPDDARRVGVDVGALTFDHPVGTANGVGYGATVRVASLDVGPIRLRDLPVSVNRAPMGGSLLGMAFLSRLDSYEVRGDRLTLRGKP